MKTKSPAFLFYSNDFISGTQFFTNEQVGMYVRLMAAQHQHGHLTEKQMILICGNKDIEVFSKYEKDDEGKYYNLRLEDEIIKRTAFSESRKNNRNKLNNDNLHIYFIKNPENNLIKIGSSVDVNRRLIELKKQYNEGLYILFISEKCSQTKEAELHKIFKDKKQFNEWFALDEQDLEKIKQLHINVHMSLHINNDMENENENENENKDINKDKSKIKNLNGISYEISKLSLVMQSQDSWLESIARKYKCSITFATDKILDFIIHLEAQGEESKTLQDAKSHYDNWFRIQKDLKLKTKNNGTNRKAGSPIPQDELLQAVAKAYGYTNTNT
jgi:hypothetical protein